MKSKGLTEVLEVEVIQGNVRHFDSGDPSFRLPGLGLLPG
jgi:hypothetical protein